MNLTSKLILHLDDDRLLAPVPAVQGDTARSVEVALYAGGQPWVIPAEATASIRYRRSDGAGDAYDTLSDGSKAWSVHDNTVTVNLVPEVLAVSGTTTMQIAMQRGEAILSTFSFQIQVQADPSAGASAPGIPSQSGGGTVELQPLTFTGAVEATYDGKKPVTVPIPDGGNVDLSNYYTKAETDNAIADAVAGIEIPDGGNAGGEYRLIYELTVDETNQATSFIISKDMEGNDFALSHLFMEANVKASDSVRSDCYLRLLGTGISKFPYVFNVETVEYNHYLSAEIIGNTLLMDCVRLSPGTTYSAYSQTGKNYCSTNGLITGLRFESGNPEAPYPVGSTVRIYGY